MATLTESEKIPYVTMPQDDMAQIDQIVREYESEPAKGLVHGVQKDAIQNGWGARAIPKEADACRDWRFTFELKEINGNNALVFWDEGTTGLTGAILGQEEIKEGIASDTLGPDQRLSRFLARFVSGENLGPGTFGRGKLIFHGASESTSILVDSLRHDDLGYLAFDRRVQGSELRQPAIPYQGDEAREFVIAETGGALQPLEQPGTRITILDARGEITEAVRLSFSKNQNAFAGSLAPMIAETWWEIISKFGAQIFIVWKDQTHQVQLQEPVATIVNAVDGKDGVHVYERNNIAVPVPGGGYRIKELRFALLPGNIDEDFREIWIQRKRMKVGGISKHIPVHPRIARKFAGYVVLEPDLEDLVEEAEGTTHYGFKLRASGVRQIREVIRSELQVFQRRLGLEPTSDEALARQLFLDAMKDLNELAPELGLVTQRDIGTDRSDAEIAVKEFNLPDPESLRVEIGQEIGPITYGLKNNRGAAVEGTFSVVANQRNREGTELLSEIQSLDSEQENEIIVPAFTLPADRFENGQPLNIKAEYIETESGMQLASSTKRLYLGTAPPPPPEVPVKLRLYCKLPRSNTRRVEMSDVISNIRLKVTNNLPFDLWVDINVAVRHLANRETGRPTVQLFSLLSQSDIELKGQADQVYDIGDLPITLEKFGAVHETLASTSERSCEIHGLVRLARASARLNRPRKWKLDQIHCPFYLEVDPPGHSIFQDTTDVDQPTNGKQSWYDSSESAGYRFVLNVGHSAYKFIRSRDDEPLTKFYIQEQMLRQAYLIAIDREKFGGPASEFEEALSASDLTTRDIADIFNTIIGTAINQVRG